MPYVKWHGRDWLGDTMLRMVDPEVRGIWIDLLCIMMNAEPYGHLAILGKPMTDQQAARLTGTDIDTYKGCLKVIEETGISSRTKCGMLYCRRLVRDHEKYLSASRYGKKGGGNPNLTSEKKEEARSQKPEAKGTIKGGYKGTYKGYGELSNVQLTGDEYDKLISKRGKKWVSDAIEILDSYIASSGKKYKSHYAVMKEGGWLSNRMKEDSAKKPSATKSIILNPERSQA